MKSLNYDKRHEQNGQIIRVRHTYPGIDLVHFCANDLMKEKWKSYGIQHPMGGNLKEYFDNFNPDVGDIIA